MSSRYDDRDDRDYDRDSQYYGQYNRRSSLDNTRSFGERAENRWGESRSGEGRSSGEGREGRYGESGGRSYGGGSSYGRGGSGGGSYGGGSYGGGRESERYGREGRGGRENWSGGRSYDRQSSSGGGRESGREGYWGRGWENERDDDMRESRYGSYGRSGAERGYSEGMRDYSQGYNYPTGFRSGESHGERGRSYDYDRDRYGQGEERGWWDRASDAVASWFGDEDAERRRHMDQQREHRRGRGPKGYRRSDERIKEDVNDRLSDDYYIDASDVEVSVSNTEVTLTGTVNSREDKRRAEDIAESVSGVTNVENRLRVKQGRYGDYSSSSYGTESSTGTGASMGSSTGTGTGTGATSGTSGISGTPGTTTSSAAAGGGKTSSNT
ncbi:MAG TPA: BON domain-containing protein [Pyrinomonadaceae bacterium]|nr:BON domain-containing protein [Pyrinomonadaceae bacterium]